jgi:hypothetical protein
MYNKILFGLVAIVLITGIARFFISTDTNISSSPVEPNPTIPPSEEVVACTMDAMQCADGSYVGRTGPDCEFVCPAASTLDPTIAASIAAKADLITISSPQPNEVIASGVMVTGQARGGWFFEASFPVTLTNWDGLIIAEGVATAQGDWMTEEFVPYTATLTFTSPLIVGAEHTKRGSLILQKDNPSGLPENADALEIPIRFAP